MISLDDALLLMEQLWETGHLSRVQVAVFCHAWVGRSYGEMAQITGYDAGYLKDTGSKLWRTLSQASGQRVTKLNFKGVLRRYGEAMVKPYPRQGHEGTVTPGGSRLGAWHYPIDLQVKDGQWSDGRGLDKLVKAKRGKLTTVLSSTFTRIRQNARRSGLRPMPVTTVGAWHYRFGTSGPPSVPAE